MLCPPTLEPPITLLKAESKGVIPLTYRAFKLILKVLKWSFTISLTTSNCPSFASHMKSSFPIFAVIRCCTVIRYSRVVVSSQQQRLLSLLAPVCSSTKPLSSRFFSILAQSPLFFKSQMLSIVALMSRRKWSNLTEEARGLECNARPFLNQNKRCAK